MQNRKVERFDEVENGGSFAEEPSTKNFKAKFF
jgi:hypothetical protein